ncbi:uncharacterized protein PRCAT00002760001 [Priceomyces carsonii]|uniref:uncharacterized protein n=1 Tax=Priceomyces carsonii TaxID=28549 RepID=UPI002EDA43EE|nr:unnamed protein product [Priceomyces carsonii]
MDTLECIDGKDIMKERFRRKICQDIYYILMLNRYFKVVAYTFHNKANELKLEIPFVTTTDDRPIGLILTPNEIEQLLALELINYNDYLLGLLRLIELMADYTSETIIQVSISPSVSNETKSRQYSVSLLNLQLITKLQSGFQMLDLKNDTIRRKYDGLKYNLKKVSGIVYDLSLRNLIKNDVELY